MARNKWLVNLFKPKEKKKTFSESITMRGYEPSFTRFGSNILYSDLILSAVKMKARFFGKLDPRHIRNKEGKITTVTDSSISKLLKNPNAYQTTYDFLTQAFFIRETQDNCFIFPDYYKTQGGSKVYTGLYILLPSQKPRVLEDEQGNLLLAFTFEGYSSEVVFSFDEICIWKQNIEDAQYLGGGKYSTAANGDLLSTIEAYHDIKQSVAEASKLGCMFDGILKVNAYGSDDEKIQSIRNKFLDDLRNNKTGIAVLDNGADYEDHKRSLQLVDSATLEELKSNLLVHSGVTIDMLQGKFNAQEKEAFYENWIEPSAVSFGQALSKVFFSQWQQSFGDEIVLYPHKVQLMATSEIVSIIQSTISAGVFKIDEYREMLGYAPLENGEGEQRPRGYNNLDGGGVGNEIT